MKAGADIDGLKRAEGPDGLSIAAKLTHLTAHDPGGDWTQVTSGIATNVNDELL